ncbi:hypothetical protein GCM10027275_48900 [Rhabdobacter roseus]|uniref:Anti-sigma-K factor RskA n=1 Tax=Rhabdobacter roseus TaxID=1655419 RepID=A0A840TUN3_9BACT|nr:hypothetical protein [Rhabdobacter roseus]MBB5286954.1 anti-sigma-K factor RskA [Rhabdobacter roseus]
MNTYQYITSGILETYLLGLASEEEKQEVERLAAANAEISAALSSLESEIERYFLQTAVPPPTDIRETIAREAQGSAIQKRGTNGQQRRPPEEPKGPEYHKVEVSDTHIRVHKLWRVAFLVVFILSKVFLALALYYYFKSAALEQEVIRLKTEITQMAPR